MGLIGRKMLLNAWRSIIEFIGKGMTWMILTLTWIIQSTKNYEERRGVNFGWQPNNYSMWKGIPKIRKGQQVKEKKRTIGIIDS